MTELVLRANAKINLLLDVIRKREDGYHEVRMVMQSVNLYDELTFIRTSEPGILIEADAADIPVDENNLIYKAAKLLMEEFSLDGGVRIGLKKVIPVAAGMAGGSADAAAALKGVNEIFGLGLSKEALMHRGVRIGADVPYCILGGTALSEGIGEILTPLPAPPKAYLLIAKPDIYVSTKYVYENLQVERLKRHPDMEGLIKGIEEGNLAKISSGMENVLETVTALKYPVIEDIKSKMKQYGALNAMMSGSGPTVFGIFDREKAAGEAFEEILGEGLAKQVFLTGFA